MKKLLKYLVVIAVILLLAWNSVYFRKLSEVKNKTEEKFDATAYVRKLWDEEMKIRLDSAIELSALINDIDSDPETSFEKYTNALAIGNYRYAFVRINGTVSEINDDELRIALPSADSLMTVDVATEFVYGNAIRDASKLVQVKDFPNTTDLNNISEEMNKIVRTEVLPSFKKNSKEGDKVNIIGAIQINKAHINWQEPEVIPMRAQIVK